MKFIKSLSVLMIVTIVTQIIMMIRSMFMANSFGVSAEMDAYNLANVLTISAMSVISVAITTILIPELSKKINQQEKEAINTFTTVVGCITLSFLVLFLLLGKPIVQLFTLNYEGDTQILIWQLTLILAVSQAFKIYTAVGTAFLQIKYDFVSAKVAAFIAVIISISYFVFSSSPNIYGVTILLGASFIFEAIYIWICWRKLDQKINISFQLKNPVFKKLVKNTFPIILSSAAFQFSLIFSNFMASNFGNGYVSVLGYSNQLINIFHTLLILNIVMMLYPTIARQFSRSIESAKSSLINYINLTNMIIIPIVFGFFVVGDLLIKILFERGNFTADNTNQVYIMTSILFIAFPFNTARDYIYRSFYSLQDTNTPSRNSLLVVVLNILLIIVLSPFIQEYSVVLGPVLAAIVSLILSYRKLQKKIGVIDARGTLMRGQLAFTLYSAFMCAVLFGVKFYTALFNVHIILQLLILVSVGIVIFSALIYLTNRNFIKEMLRK
ncbi:murein biosynthesis integral membrane protein MurJ [Priestia flexa]|uniref:murein biosynthesis integral membrane protein MurJ n=1 Tax=Priestia flexa TaxID=86664 RepID=UPI00249143F0|nr:lipid II flippase MurJ [Priestia flexa]